MLGKLIKYDFRFGARTFLGLIGVLLALGAVAPLLGDDMILGISASVMLIVVAVVSIILVAQAFHKSLFAQQGYLTRTLPVTSSALLGSKLITAMVWFNAICLSVVLYVMLTMRSVEPIQSIAERPWDFVLLGVSLETQGLMLILTLYTLLTMGSVSVNGRRLGVVGYIVGAVIPIGLSALLSNVVLPVLTPNRYLMISEQGVSFVPDATGQYVTVIGGGADVTVTMISNALVDWISLAANLIVAAACFFTAVWLLKRKSNLA
ncbi:MAG: hypothetical protein LBT60_01065 [Oscillospiraceae bacterium]|jgi:ABC-type transport system involved in multi-copper enzyme maturation permease subunit|nr:hypothetical protein [Oscillospiraceae bacterium]